MIDRNQQEAIFRGFRHSSADENIGVISIRIHEIHVQKSNLLRLKNTKFRWRPVGSEIRVLYEFLERANFELHLGIFLGEEGMTHMCLIVSMGE